MLYVEIDPSKAMTKLSVADDTWQQAGKDYDSIIWVSEPKVTKAEWDGAVSELQTELDAQEYARNRQNEYPTINELTVALYDTDDKAALETKRAAVKTKWPKDNSGPVE